MATKIHIKNFQSIKDLNFEIDGFTVLIGKNNIGKSAVIRAISAALNNEAEKNHLRLGEKSMEVRVTRPEIDFTWSKEDSASYKITTDSKKDEIYTKLNRAIPEPLIKAGFDKISIDDASVSPLIAEQFSPLFLLDKRGSVITEVLTDLYDMDILNIADEKCQKELKSNKSLLKTREIDSKNLQNKLEKYKIFESLKITIERLVQDELKIQELRKEIEELIIIEQDFNTTLSHLDNLKKIKNVTIPDTKEIENLLPDYTWLLSTEQELEIVTNSIKKLKDVAKITIPDFSSISSQMPELSWLQDKEKELNSLTALIKDLQNIEKIEIPDTKSIEESIKNFSEISEIEKSLKDQATLTRAIRDELVDISAKYDSKSQEFLAIKICPLCERPWHHD